MKHTRLAQALTALALVAILLLHLLPALLAGLLVFLAVHGLAGRLPASLQGKHAKLGVLAGISTVVVAAATFVAVAAASFFGSEANLQALAVKMAEILEASKHALPVAVSAWLPADIDSLRTGAAGWLREHGNELGRVGKETLHGFAQVLIGFIIGAMLAMKEATLDHEPKPFAVALSARAGGVAEAFRKIVFAQAKISAVNAALTALYLLVALPLFGIHLPLGKTIVAVTFVAGLLPVIGNLISNAVIVVISLSVSPHLAAASLMFLVVVHKLEYFLNARIVGGEIAAKSWELLLAMLVMEAAFGMPGVVAAPIYYAHLKAELVKSGLV